ncbi:MAG: hypothetical protein ABUL46_06145 [Chitinophaga rupis]
MTEHQFDDQFRNRLGDYSSQVPEDMWDRVRPKKDKNRKGFFFWLRYVILPGCLLVGLAAAHFMISHPSGQHKTTGLTTTNASQESSQVPVASQSPVASSPSASSPSQAASQAPAPPSSSAPPLSPSPTPAQPLATLHSPVLSSRSGARVLHPSRKEGLSPESPSRPPSTQASAGPPAPRLPHTRLPGLQPIPHSPGRVTAQIPLKKPAAPAKKDSPVITHNWVLDVYASPDWPFASNKPPHQKMLFSYTAGIKLSRPFGQHFSGTIGLQYSELKSKTPHSDSSLVPGTAHYSSSSIDIPLLIGYTITKNHFSTAVNTGIIFNARTSGVPYKQHTGFSLYLGFDIAGKINDRISLFAEPYFRYRLSNMVDDPYSFAQKVHVAGLSVGLRYNFKKSKK